MKFTLKDYQAVAVQDVLSNLRKACRRWREEGDKHAFSLTATTGAGKTVMAAAAFEALFYGDDNFDFEADPETIPGAFRMDARELEEKDNPLPTDRDIILYCT